MYVLEQAGTQESILRTGDEQDRLHSRGQSAVHGAHHRLAFQVGGVPDSLDHDPRTARNNVLYHKSAKAIYGNVRQALAGVPGHLYAFLETEHVTLLGVPCYGHNEAVKQRRGPGGDVQMAAGERVETSGVDRNCQDRTCRPRRWGAFPLYGALSV